MSRNTTQTARPSNNSLIASAGQFYALAVAKLEFGDLVLFFYFIAIIRQCFWSFTNNSLAWVLSGVAALLLWSLYVRTKQFPRERFDRSFWLIVGSVLFIAFSLRAAFPVLSFDVLTYHILQGERTLRGPLFQSGDFFHSVPFNPLPDTINGISRWLLGYRLGTAINLLVLLWTAQIADKLLRVFIKNNRLRSALIVMAVLTENVFFEISTYMVDLLMLPLLLQATFLTLHADESENPQVNFAHVSLLLGVSAAFKLTTLAVGIPLLTICAYKIGFGSHRFRMKTILGTLLLMLLYFALPLIPFSIYIFRLTGNPVFPVANSFFQSPYWPTTGGWDARWGPHTIQESFLWPILIWFKPDRHSELGVYGGRLSVGFIVAIIGLILLWRNQQVRLLCLLLVSSALLWSQTAMGYSRYGMFQDLIAGITIVAVAGVLIDQAATWSRVSGSFLLIVLGVQFLMACGYALKTEWSGRPTLLESPSPYFKQVRFMFRDRSPRRFLAQADLDQFQRVRGWIESTQKSSAFEVLLNPHAPIIALHQPEFFATQRGMKDFIDKVKAIPEGGLFSLCLSPDLSQARKAIEQRGLVVGEVTPLDLPFFSSRDRIGMMLIEVLIPQETDARERFESEWMKSGYPDSDYRQEITPVNMPGNMRVNERRDLVFKVKNIGSATWSAFGTKDGKHRLHLGDRWLRDGAIIEDARGELSSDVSPGAEVEIRITITAPSTPGSYTLKFDMVHEGVTWFDERGATPLLIPVVVTP